MERVGFFPTNDGHTREESKNSEKRVLYSKSTSEIQLGFGTFIERYPYDPPRRSDVDNHEELIIDQAPIKKVATKVHCCCLGSLLCLGVLPGLGYLIYVKGRNFYVAHHNRKIDKGDPITESLDLYTDYQKILSEEVQSVLHPPPPLQEEPNTPPPIDEESNTHKKSQPMIFGQAAWAARFGAVKEVLHMPIELIRDLESPCCFYPGKKKHQTHIALLVPQMININGSYAFLTAHRLWKCIATSEDLHAFLLGYYSPEISKDLAHTTIPRSRWITITKDVIPGSCGKTYAEQKKLLHDQGGEKGYRPISLLEALIGVSLCDIMQEQTFNNCNWHYTRCLETVTKEKHPVLVGRKVAEDRFLDVVHGSLGLPLCQSLRIGMVAARLY